MTVDGEPGSESGRGDVAALRSTMMRGAAGTAVVCAASP
jgi:hypothetical protein